MSRYIFLFDLDSTVIKTEILPAICRQLGFLDSTSLSAENTMSGEFPFIKKFLQKMDILKKIPISEVRQMIEKIELNQALADFIQQHHERCYIITENPDVWIEGLIRELDMEHHTFCSKALVEDNFILNIFPVIDKNIVARQFALPYVAVGNGNDNAEMIENANIGIGYGGVCEISPAVLNSASHAIYEENKLVEFLERLL
ncbi:MAG: haloacid dehalogenase-like hydrolase [Lachnospiraceae bacterium]|nr:haloacid dehalogenase-like hydrolase [Lachnospiraceae bacterium]MCM1233796.1 haloacid dehalogenase-like hydrolase [Ruminococcus flavefaciens]